MACDRPVIMDDFVHPGDYGAKVRIAVSWKSWCLEPYGGEAERHSNSLCTQIKEGAQERLELRFRFQYLTGGANHIVFGGYYKQFTIHNRIASP